MKTKGVEHDCKKTNMERAVLNITKTRSARGQAKIIRNFLVEQANQAWVSAQGGQITLNSGGRHLHVQVGKPR